MNRLLQKFLVYAEFRIKRLWWFLRYGSIQKVPPKVLREHFDKQFEMISRELAGTNQELPRLMKDVWKYGNEGQQERIMNLLRNSADIDEQFDMMKQTTDILLKAVSKEPKK